MIHDLADKIQDEDTWATVVNRSVDEKLLHVKGDFDDIKNSVKKAKLSLKGTKNFIHDEKDEQNRKNNAIIYKIAESKAKENVVMQKDDKNLFSK